MAEEAEIFEEDEELVSANPEEETVKSSRSSLRRPPFNYLAITEDAVVPIDIEETPLGESCNELYQGVVLQQGKKKYWVDRQLNKNCFMLFARELGIAWGDDSHYWDWMKVKESGGVDVEVAVLKEVCWLEMNGKFRTIGLLRETLYEIKLVAMIKDWGDGWTAPVTFDVTLPNEEMLKHMERLLHMQRGVLLEIVMGEFTTSSKNIGEIKFCASECSGVWKKGLVVKGVSFVPKIAVVNEQSF